MDVMDAVPTSGPMPMNTRADKGKSAESFDAPVLDRRHVALANQLSVRRHPIAFDIGDAVLAFSPVGLASIGTETADQVVIGLRIDGRPAVLRLSAGLYERILTSIEPELLVADLHDDMLPLLLEASISDALLAAEARFQGRINILTIERGRAVEQDGLAVLFEIAINGDTAGKASLRLDEALAERLADVLAVRPKLPMRYGSLKAELSFRGGVTWLDLGELRSLQLGDVLLTDEDAVKGEDIAATLGETWLLNAAFKDAGLTLTKPLRLATEKDRDLWMMVDSTNRNDDGDGLSDPLEEDDLDIAAGGRRADQQPDPTPGPEPERQNGPIDDGQADDVPFDGVPIKLVFELGRQETSLGRLQELGPGHVFQLDRPLGDAVDVFAGGRRIGQGEIVKIDEQVGVRMTRLFGHG